MKNIKTYNSIFGVVMSALIMISCSDSLEKLPPQSLSNEVALSTEENVNQVLIGVYDAISNADLFGGEILRNSELLAADEEIIFSGTFNAPSEIWRKEMLTTNSDITEAWLDGYKTINTANNVLKAVDDGVVTEEPNRIRGEALFLRGLMYFELVKYFALPYSAGNTTSNLGVPLLLEPTASIDGNSFPARNTVEEVYSQVISDLSTAASLLEPTNDVYANSVAAYAVLTRVYLQQADYTNAQQANNSALSEADGNYTLEPNFEEAFNLSANGVEDIFSIQVLSTDVEINAMQNYYGPQAFGGRGDIEILDRHVDFYDPNDIRLNFHYDDPSTGELRAGKWQDQFGNVGSIRYAELLLNQAELSFRLNGASSEVDDAINTLRNRAQLADIAVTDLNQIFLERKLELAHEGHAIHDFKRTQGAFYLLEPANGGVDASGDGLVDGFAYDSDILVYPIPDREIQVNTNLTQNPGY